MVEGDVGHHGHAAVPGMGGIEPAAESHLNQSQIDVRFGEPEERRRRQQFELRGVAVTS